MKTQARRPVRSTEREGHKRADATVNRRLHQVQQVRPDAAPVAFLSPDDKRTGQGPEGDSGPYAPQVRPPAERPPSCVARYNSQFGVQRMFAPESL